MLRSIMGLHDHGDDDHDDHGGLHRDLLSTGAVMDRRRALRLAARVGAGLGAGLGALSLLGCGGDAASALTGATTGTTTGTGASGTSASTCAAKIPAETAGPFPGDGSNGANVLNLTGVVRQDIRSSFAGLSGTAAGIPLRIELTLVSASSCAPLTGYAVYLWHCDRAGNYSLYSSGVTNQNYLRGVQAADAAGKVSFTSIFPGCYSGRWPHIHFEVYKSLGDATAVGNKIATSQIALPDEINKVVYAESSYSSSPSIYATVSLGTDLVFSDGTNNETPTVTGSVAEGYTIALSAPIDA
jgi:protocatechuate 3,4-dioxygenase beta subunit